MTRRFRSSSIEADWVAMQSVTSAAAVLALLALCAAPCTLDAQSPSLEQLLDGASTYADQFFNQFANVVAEEQYVQEAEWRGESTKQTRVLRSDFLLVTFPGLNGRIRFATSSKSMVAPCASTSQADRLVRLFGDAPPDVVRRAREITEASAGYHLAHIETDPFVALGFLQAVFRPRFRFQRGEGDSGAGPNVSTVRFEERQRPTILRTGADKNLTSRGRIWIEEPTGRVLKTELLLRLERDSREIVTTYRWDDELQMHVPSEVRESYVTPPSVVRGPTFRGVATYSRFRRFQVRTEQTIR